MPKVCNTVHRHVWIQIGESNMNIEQIAKVCQNFVMRPSSAKVYISVCVVLQKWKNLSKLQIAALIHTHPA